MARTEVIFHENYLKRFAIQDFKDRLEILLQLFNKNSIEMNEWIRITKPTPISLEDILQLHHKTLVEELIRTNWFEISRLSAGGAVLAAKHIVEKRVQNAYVLIPVGGHHASPHSHWGFCYLNETAFVVDFLRKQGIERILYIDQDYHHADGTEKFFQNDPNLFFLCLHGARELGSFVKFRKTWNHLDIALPLGIGSLEYLDVMRNAIEVSKYYFEPEFLIAYMGYDGHYLDSFSRGKMKLNQYIYYKLIVEYTKLASECMNNNLLCILGGGYNANENAIAIFNAIMTLSENWDLIISTDPNKIQETDEESAWKTSLIMRDLDKLTKNKCFIY